MNSKQKAMELINKYLDFDFQLIKEYMPNPIGCAKKCAIIAVDEIIEASPALPILGDGGYFSEDIDLSTAYWQEVKNHLNKL